MTDQMQIPFPVPRDHRGFPPRCRKCWYREGARCFNDRLGTVPTRTRTYTTEDGNQSSYTERVGFNITDDHYNTCLQHPGYLSRRGHLAKVFVGPKETT